ncbi:MAG TPA: peptidase M23 [Leeuwenhoekiella sp.]|nr:peptidase M23 [Leeuwenhoekiella sp.]
MSIDKAKRDLFLKSLTQSFVPLLDADHEEGDYIPLDLSINNDELRHIDVASSRALWNYVNTQLQKNRGKIGYGGYNERRDIYSRSVYFNQNDSATQRNIHLGLDFWCEADTAVLAAYPGMIHSFKDNRNHGDYGPCIILKHKVKETSFYTLYGHLSRVSLKNIEVGQRLSAGDVLAYLGTPDENGDYAPHLHFQIIMDIENYYGDYPGVSSAKNLMYFLENCPDPNLLLKIY